MTRTRFLWAARPVQALLEAWLIGLAIFFLLSRQAETASAAVLANGVFFLCGTCGLWVVLRSRLPQGSLRRQALWEVGVGLALSLVMGIGVGLPVRFLGWEQVWLRSGLRSLSLGQFFLFATGLGYLVARAGVRLWLVWGQLRRRRMLFSIAHAHLILVVAVILFLAVAAMVTSFLASIGEPAGSEAGNRLVALFEYLLHTVFPASVTILFVTLAILAVLLPFSALFSFFVARRTTRRLEALAQAAAALPQGQYAIRVEVAGEDEVAQLQTSFNKMADQLARTLRDLEAERDEVAAVLRSRRELVAGISHELRTPVATMRATVESALHRPPEEIPDSLRHDLAVVDGEIQRLQRLIEDLFTQSQAEVEGLTIECRALDVVPVVQRMVDALAPLAWASGRVEVVAEPPTELPAAHADEARLEQVLANLLRNAIRHTPPGGIVAVAAWAEPDAVVIEVRDTGEGIAPADLPHIWERFYQGESTRGRGGAGLGLALVKELTEAMGGSVAVESELGQGSRFSITLPRVSP